MFMFVFIGYKQYKQKLQLVVAQFIAFTVYFNFVQPLLCLTLLLQGIHAELATCVCDFLPALFSFLCLHLAGVHRRTNFKSVTTAK